jgi:hypothetical protein
MSHPQEIDMTGISTILVYIDGVLFVPDEIFFLPSPTPAPEICVVIDMTEEEDADISLRPRRMEVQVFEDGLMVQRHLTKPILKVEVPSMGVIRRTYTSSLATGR